MTKNKKMCEEYFEDLHNNYINANKSYFQHLYEQNLYIQQLKSSKEETLKKRLKNNKSKKICQ